MDASKSGAADPRPLHLIDAASPAAPTSFPRRPRRWRRVVIASAVIVALATAWFQLLRPVPVQVVTVLPAPFDVTRTAPGTLEARRLARIGFPTSGRLVALTADLGDRVEDGAVLARLDDRDLTAAIDSAEASLKAAEMAVEAARAEEASATASLANARSDYARSQRLVGNGATSRADDERLATGVKTAEAALNRAKAARLQAEAGVAAASAAVRESEARRRNAEAIAPFAGIVTDRRATVGDGVAANASVLDLVDPASLYVEARFDETAFGSLAIGQKASVVLGSRPDAPLSGRVVRLGHAADPETREVIAEIGLDAMPPAWAVGQRADVAVVTAVLPAALAVPTRAIRWRNGTGELLAVVNGRARRVPVELGAGDAAVTAITRGLAPGDRVIVSGDVRSFRRVSVRP